MLQQTSQTGILDFIKTFRLRFDLPMFSTATSKMFRGYFCSPAWTLCRRMLSSVSLITFNYSAQQQIRCFLTKCFRALSSDTSDYDVQTLPLTELQPPCSQGVSFIRQGNKMQNLHRPVNRNVDRRTLSIYHPENQCHFSAMNPRK